MWSPNNLKRLQTDTEGDCQHIFLEKRQRALRKKRKKVSAPNSEQYSLGNSHPSSLVSLPGLSKKRLTRKVGGLSNGVQGSVPAIRKVQQRLDHDLEHRQIDFNSFKGPPTYINLPRPSIFEDKLSVPKNRDCVRDQPIFVSKGRSRATHRGNVSSRSTSRGPSVDSEMERVFKQINEKLSATISQTWPNVSYETRLQATLNKQITERFAARAMRHTPPQGSSVKEQGGRGHGNRGSGSGSSSTTLSKPFSSWYINGDTDRAADFNKSFCRTIKRTFFKPPQPSPEQDNHLTSSQHHVPSSNPHVTSPMYEMYDSVVNVSASALDLFKTQPKLETTLDSGRGSATDFLDTITDGYDPYNYHTLPDTPASQPDLVVRGVKKDFIDVVDNMYHDEIMKEQCHRSSHSKPYITALRKQPVSDQYSNHVTKKKPMRDQYSLSNKENKNPSGGRKRMKNKQFYLRKEWLK